LILPCNLIVIQLLLNCEFGYSWEPTVQCFCQILIHGCVRMLMMCKLCWQCIKHISLTAFPGIALHICITICVVILGFALHIYNISALALFHWEQHYHRYKSILSTKLHYKLISPPCIPQTGTHYISTCTSSYSNWYKPTSALTLHYIQKHCLQFLTMLSITFPLALHHIQLLVQTHICTDTTLHTATLPSVVNYAQHAAPTPRRR
jgi:hypothetical protein